MTLRKYKEKRDFSKTSEPKEGKSKEKDKLIFVIQKHAATNLHYDFRLEMDGVLKSWAVPKGPTTDPAVKRLAMMVEDHPYDYRTFEGIIPKGQYGGGTVIVWDEGYYEPLEEFNTKKEQEKHLLQQLESGSLKIKLHGEKLQGEFALVKTKGMAENSWLLIKHKDEYASKSDITKNEKSVKSGKTLEQVEKGNQVEKENKVGKGNKEKEEKPGKEASTSKIDTSSLLKKAKKGKIPTGIKPMLATLVDKPFDDPDWLYEVKWDGYRALGFINKGKVDLLSRNNKSFNEKYYPLTELLSGWEMNAVIDCEIVVIDEEGISD